MRRVIGRIAMLVMALTLVFGVTAFAATSPSGGSGLNPNLKVTKTSYKVKRGKTVKIKYSRKGSGKVTFTKKSTKKYTVTKAGKLKIKKAAKKGSTLKINVKITVAKSGQYAKKQITKKIKVKVK